MTDCTVSKERGAGPTLQQLFLEEELHRARAGTVFWSLLAPPAPPPSPSLSSSSCLTFGSTHLGLNLSCKVTDDGVW